MRGKCVKWLQSAIFHGHEENFSLIVKHFTYVGLHNDLFCVFVIYMYKQMYVQVHFRHNISWFVVIYSEFEWQINNIIAQTKLVRLVFEMTTTSFHAQWNWTIQNVGKKRHRERERVLNCNNIHCEMFQLGIVSDDPQFNESSHMNRTPEAII